MFELVLFLKLKNCNVCNSLNSSSTRFFKTLFSSISEIIKNTIKKVIIKSYQAVIIKDALSELRQYLENESPLKMIKNAFNFNLKTLFVLKIFKFLS